MTKKLVQKIIPFIREEGSRGVTTIAIVRCRAASDTTSASIVEALQDVITQWCQESDDGIFCWSYSCGDLNIGDLSQYDKSFVGTHGKALMDKGIHDFEILWLGDVSESIPFDRVLAHSAVLEEEE